MITIKLEALEDTMSFYNVELKKEDLTEKERGKYLRALEVIRRIIETKKCSLRRA